jgi:NADPH:quinone reductase-like Zn-dependent oxidoreductase
MKAYFLERYHATKEVFALKELSLHPLNENELEIEVSSFGLNYADVMARNGIYKEAPPLPCVLGYEVVGVVKKVQNESHRHLIGKRILGFTRFGGYAQRLNLDINSVIEIDDIPTNLALSLATQGCTAWYMMERTACVQAGDVVLIHAATGGVGSLLIQLCKLKGAFVIAKVGSNTKKEIALSYGADFVVNYNEVNYAEVLHEKFGPACIDVSFNPSGGSTFKKDFKLLVPSGKLVLFGAAELSGSKWGVLSQLNFVRKMGLLMPIALLMSSKTIAGVNMLKVAARKPMALNAGMNILVNLVKEGKIKTLTGKQFPHTDLHKAHDYLASGKSSGKIGIDW